LSNLLVQLHNRATLVSRSAPLNHAFRSLPQSFSAPNHVLHRQAELVPPPVNGGRNVGMMLLLLGRTVGGIEGSLMGAKRCFYVSEGVRQLFRPIDRLIGGLLTQRTLQVIERAEQNSLV